MGLPGPFELLIILLIVALLFGTKKLRSLGGDLGGAIKNFKSAVTDTDKPDQLSQTTNSPADGKTIEGEVEPEENSQSKP